MLSRRGRLRKGKNQASFRTKYPPSISDTNTMSAPGRNDSIRSKWVFGPMANRFIYTWVGPTVKHLQLEVALILSMGLLTASSLKALYKVEFGTTWRDGAFLALHTLWMSKYVLWRIMCLWNPRTLANPSLVGWIAQFLKTHAVGGQVFDQPTPKQMAKVLSIQNHKKEEDAFLRLVPNYGMQWWRMNIWLPFLRIMDQAASSTYHHDARDDTLSSNQNSERKGDGDASATTSTSAASTTNNNPSGTTLQSSDATVDGTNSLLNILPRIWMTASSWTSGRRRRGTLFYNVSHTLSQLTQYLWSHAPTLQYLLSNVLSYFILYPIFVYLQQPKEPIPTPSALYNSGFTTQIKADDARTQRYGAYRPFNLHSVPDLFLFLLAVNFFLACTMFFARVLPPIPDQIAGNHPANDIRQEAAWLSKHYYNKSSSSTLQQTSWWRFWQGGSPAAAYTSSVEADSVYTERQYSLVREHRLNVHRLVWMWRMLDIILAVGWLPRSDFLARALGHASAPHDRHLDFYPIGLVQPHRPDAWGRFWHKQVQDPTSFVWHVWNVLLIPTILLGVQMLYLNRQYLANASYFSTEWTLVGPASVDMTLGSTVWDPRKKYKQNDLVVYEKYVYQAAHNQPEGRPVDPDLHDWQGFCLNELGHAGTSDLMYRAFWLQMVSTLLQFLWWLGAFFRQSKTPDGLLLALVCNLVASHALSVVGNTDYQELSSINNAIRGRPQAWK